MGLTVQGVSDLVALGWYRGDDEYDYGPFFCQFSDTELDVFRAEFGSLLDRGLLDTVLELQMYLDPAEMYRLVADHGSPTGPGYLQKVLIASDGSLEG